MLREFKESMSVDKGKLHARGVFRHNLDRWIDFGEAEEEEG